MSSVYRQIAAFFVAVTVIVSTAHGQTSVAPIPPASAPSVPEIIWLKNAIVSEVAKSVKDANGEKGWKDPTVLVAAGAVLLTFASLTFSFYQFRRNRSDTLDWKERDSRASRQAKLLESLKWFEGGIQNRAVGIAVIEGHWVDQPELRPTWASVLVAQAVYILSKPEEELPQHEARNLRRILELLRRARADIPVEILGHAFLQPVSGVLAELPTKATKTKEGKKLLPNDRVPFMEQVRAALEPYRDLIDVPDLPRGVT